MPPRARTDPIGLDDDLYTDDIFGDLRPTDIPAHLSHSGARGAAGSSGSGSRWTADTNDNINQDRAFGGTGEGVKEMDWEEDNERDPLIPELIRHWTNERLAPDILDQRGELVQRVLERVREQASLVQQLRADPEASEDEHFQIILVQTEVERIRFIVRSYMRTRIHKIEKFAHYILENPDIQQRLSTMELNHAQSYASLLDSQFDTSVLNAMPAWIRHEGPNWQGPSTISKPNKGAPLFVHALQDIGQILLPEGRPIEITKGSIFLVRFSTIENNLRRGEVELV